MNWKKILFWSAVVIVLVRFSGEIKGALSGVPGVKQLIGA